MKKIAFTLFFSLMALGGNSQITTIENDDIIEDGHSIRKNEIKLNAAFLLAGAFEVTYEGLINEESAWGISAMLPVSREIKESLKYYISPYYRVYFGKKNNATGFFAEGFGMLNESERYLYVENSNESELQFVTDFALGVGLGGKWVTRSNIIFELNLGIGRNLFQETDGDFIVGKGGITIGYRF